MTELTKKEKEIKHYLENTRLTHEQIGDRLKISRSTVSTYASRIREKEGKKLSKKKNVDKKTHVWGSSTNDVYKIWRFHNLHFQCKPYYFYDRFKSNVGSSFTCGDWRVKVHAQSLELQLLADRHFSSSDKWESSRLASESLNSVLDLLADRLGFEWRKDGSIYVKCVNGHLALEDEATGRAISGDEFFQVRGDDGKVWFQVDKSKGFSEPEFVHPKEHFDDSEAVEPFFNGLKDHYVRTGESLTLNKLLFAVNKNTEHLGYYAENVKSHVGAVNDLSGGVGVLVDTIRDFKSEVISLFERAGISRLSILKNKITDKEDVFKFEKEIKSLSDEDKVKFTEWFHEEFSL